jgi:CHASE1-domain containing sensor protein
MKAVYICAAILILFIIVQTVLAMSSQKTEQQAYRVVLEERDFEIRFYPEATMARAFENWLIIFLAAIKHLKVFP